MQVAYLSLDGCCNSLKNWKNSGYEEPWQRLTRCFVNRKILAPPGGVSIAASCCDLYLARCNTDMDKACFCTCGACNFRTLPCKIDDCHVHKICNETDTTSRFTRTPSRFTRPPRIAGRSSANTAVPGASSRRARHFIPVFSLASECVSQYEWSLDTRIRTQTNHPVNASRQIGASAGNDRSEPLSRARWKT